MISGGVEQAVGTKRSSAEVVSIGESHETREYREFLLFTSTVHDPRDGRHHGHADGHGGSAALEIRRDLKTSGCADDNFGTVDETSVSLANHELTASGSFQGFPETGTALVWREAVKPARSAPLTM